MNILHLSDLHFGTVADARNWYSQLADDLKGEIQCSALDAVVLSGDIANRSTPKEYSAAAEFLRSLCKEFRVQPKSVIIVPGNHDLNWALAKRSYRLKRREDYEAPGKKKPEAAGIIDRGEYIELCDPSKYRARFSHFAAFYKDVRGDEYPPEYASQGILYHFPENRLLVLGLNSAWQLDHHYTSRAGINPDALSTALDRVRLAPDIYGNCAKFVVWHHPVDSPFEDRITDKGFMQRLAQAGFFVALHGHIHKAEASEYRRELAADGRRISIVCAGTFGAPIREWVPGHPLQYNLLRFEHDKLTIETRCRREMNGAWCPDAIWKSGPGRDPLPRYEVPVYIEPARRYSSESASTHSARPVAEPAAPSRVEVGSSEVEAETAGNKAPATATPKAPPVPTRSTLPLTTMLIVAFCPSTTSRLRLGEEVREITAALRHSGKHRYVVEVCWATRYKDLRRALLDVEPQIVHFCGHGTNDGILLEDDDGRARPVSAGVLGKLFEILASQLGHSIKFVVFNSCYSEQLVESLAPNVGRAIGTKSAIQDKAAIEFVTAFYEALAAGHSVDAAYRLACHSLEAVGYGDDASSPIIRSMGALDHTTASTLSHAENMSSTPAIHPHGDPLKVVILASNPINSAYLRLDTEVREISSVLRSAVRRGSVVLEQRWSVRFGDLQQALFDVEPDVVHFSGCCTMTGGELGLLLEDNEGRSEPLRVETLSNALDLCKRRVRCIVLNASNSAMLLQALLSSVDYAIGMPDQISDREAIAFAVGFYRALGSGRTIERAYTAGCNEMRQQGAPPGRLAVLVAARAVAI